ncbi:MAG: hypothetical protein Q9181_007977, partial [Wetmoreana brouardii]
MPATKHEVEELEKTSMQMWNTRSMQDAPPDTEMVNAVLSTINDLPVRTRAKVQVVKQNAAEAGMWSEEKKKPKKPSKPESRNPTKPKSAQIISETEDEASISEPEEDEFESDHLEELAGGIGVDHAAWKAWEKAQADFVRSCNSSHDTPGASRPPYPDTMKDLAYELDDDEDDSPRTYHAQMKHWCDFNTLIATLQEYGKGCETGYLKIKVPKEALICPANAPYPSHDFMIKSHSFSLDPLPEHRQFDNTGVYRRKLSKTTSELSAIIWRVMLKDYDRDIQHSAFEKQLEHKKQLKHEMALLEKLDHLYPIGNKRGTDFERKMQKEYEKHEKRKTSLQQKINDQEESIRFNASIFSEEDMLAEPTAATFSPNNPATLAIHRKLDLPSPLSHLYAPGTEPVIHLAASPCATLGLRNPPQFPKIYKLYYLHPLSAPLTWTIIPATSLPTLLKNIHCATHAYPRVNSPKPRLPPQEGALGQEEVYVARETLDKWGVEWRHVKQYAGECVALGPGTAAQFFWEE